MSRWPRNPPSPTVTAVAIGGLPGHLDIGQSAQMRAFAVLSDGSTPLEVTANATFAPTRPEIALVSPTGLVTGVAPGQGGIRVEYQTMSGVWAIDVVGPDIAAFVHENSP